MKRFWNNCNKLQLFLFALMAFQAVTAFTSRQWVWAIVSAVFALANAWWMLPPFTQVRLQLFFHKKGK